MKKLVSPAVFASLILWGCATDPDPEYAYRESCTFDEFLFVELKPGTVSHEWCMELERSGMGQDPSNDYGLILGDNLFRDIYHFLSDDD